MFTTPAKSAKEDLARAKKALWKDDLERALIAAQNAVETMLHRTLVGKERYEVEVYLGNFLRDLNRAPKLQDHLMAANIGTGKDFFVYARGREQELAARLANTAKSFAAKAKLEEEVQEAKKVRKKEELLKKGQSFLDIGDFPRAKGYLRRAAEAYGEEPGLLADVGTRLFKAGLPLEAAEILQKAVDAFPNDPAAYGPLVQAYMSESKYAEAETLYKQALKVFGAHPRTHLNMAKLYLAWRKFDQAYDYAKQALSTDASLTEAQQIIDFVGPKIFTSRGSGGMTFL